VVLLPIAVALLALLLDDARILLAIFAGYAIQTVRIAVKRGRFNSRNIQSAAMLMLAKFPETLGALSYFVGKPANRVADYKAS
jgi:hypothetical protein